jgi:translocation and assembly module TamB
VDVRFHARKILAESNASFNVDIDRSLTQLRFDFTQGTLKVKEATDLSLPQAPKVRLRADLERTGNGALHYRGKIESGALKLGDPKIEKMLGKPRLAFEGDMQALEATLDAGVFAGRFVSEDLKKGLLELGTRKKLPLARYVKLPKKLAKAWATLAIRVPVDFAKPLPLTSELDLRSNLAELKGTVRYDGNVSAETTLHFPKNSLLAAFDPKLNLKAIDPLKIRVRQKGELWKLALESRKLKGAIDYSLGNGRMQGEIDLAGSRIKIEGSPQETITATLHAPSVKKMLQGVTDLYRVEIPKLDGDITLTLKVEQLARASLELRSKQFVPDDTARIKSPIKNIQLLVGADLKRQALIVKKYHLETEGMTIFATKPSRLSLKKDRLVLEELWVNDSLKLQGAYDLKKQRGEVKGKATRFKVVHENAKLEAAIDLDAKIVGEKIDLKGKIVILGGNVQYDIAAKHYATDEDIIIVQHRKKDEESFFRKNVQINLYITAKKPLLFKQKDVYVELRPQLSVIKGFEGDLQVMGSVGLAKGGYYIFEGKRFVLQPSSVNFTGKPTQPLLDINLVYRRYSRTVYISVTGVATEPSLNFSSDPYMSRDQILSFILFDTTDSGENAGDMLSLVGGGIAKSILGNLGLKVDTLILTQEGFEVGKKITDKITVLYDQKEEDPKIIVRVQHSQRTETDISIGSESQSVDIIYKREF